MGLSVGGACPDPNVPGPAARRDFIFRFPVGRGGLAAPIYNISYQPPDFLIEGNPCGIVV